MNPPNPANPPGRHRRAWVGLGLVAGVLLVAAVVTAVALSHRESPGPTPVPLGRPTHHVRPATAAPPQPPVAGVWLGAWAQPSTWGAAGREAAVADLETSLGRPLDVVHTFHDFADPFPSEAERHWLEQDRTLLISWAGADTQQINAGRYDQQLRVQAAQLRDLDQPVLLRWRWEMNRANLHGQVHDPAAFVAAWRRIHTIFGQEGATNVGWVWCPQARDFEQSDGPAYYPGDRNVDWLCADVYAGPDTNPFTEVSAQFRQWAAAIDKPVLIGELGAQQPGPQRVSWWQGAFDAVAGWPQVKAVVLFDSRGSADEPFNLWLPDDPAVLAAVRDRVNQPPFTTGSTAPAATPAASP
jgi:hypothetical protein